VNSWELYSNRFRKYEKGINRIGASRLQAISEILEVSLSFFSKRLPTLIGKNFAKSEINYMDFYSKTEGV